MDRRWVVLLAALAAAALVALPATAAKKPEKEYKLLAAMSGLEERPGPGDDNGYGAASIRIKGANVCFVLLAREIAPATAAHIHKAPAGEPGPIVVGLYGSTAADSKLPPRVSRCVKAESRALAKDIARNPSAYYVNVHNGDFPQGAIRGQLSR
jgi:hypothetical protein